MKRGRKAHVPTEATRKEVTQYARIRVPLDKLAKLIGITEKTLNKYYKPEIESGRAYADAYVLNKLFQGIDRGSERLITLYARTQLGWKEHQIQEFMGEIKATGWGVNIIEKALPALPQPDE